MASVSTLASLAPAAISVASKFKGGGRIKTELATLAISAITTMAATGLANKAIVHEAAPVATRVAQQSAVPVTAAVTSTLTERAASVVKDAVASSNAALTHAGLTEKQSTMIAVVSGLKGGDARAMKAQMDEAARLGAAAVHKAGINGNLTEQQLNDLTASVSSSLEARHLAAAVQEKGRLHKTKAVSVGVISGAVGITAAATALAVKPLAWLSDKILRTNLSQSVSFTGALKKGAMVTAGVFGAAAVYDLAKRAGRNSARDAALKEAIQTGMRNASELRGSIINQPSAEVVAQVPAPAQDQAAAPSTAATAATAVTAAATTAAVVSATAQPAATTVAANAPGTTRKPRSAPAQNKPAPVSPEVVVAAVTEAPVQPAVAAPVTEVAQNSTQRDIAETRKALAEQAATVAALAQNAMARAEVSATPAKEKKGAFAMADMAAALGGLKNTAAISGGQTIAAKDADTGQASPNMQQKQGESTRA